MATGVIVVSAAAAYESAIIIYSYHLFVRHQFFAIFAIAVVVITAIFTDVIVRTYVIHSPLQFFPTFATMDLLCVIHL